MRHLRHDNVAPLRDVLCTGDDVFLVYELMDTDLHRILRRRSCPTTTCRSSCTRSSAPSSNALGGRHAP